MAIKKRTSKSNSMTVKVRLKEPNARHATLFLQSMVMIIGGLNVSVGKKNLSIEEEFMSYIKRCYPKERNPTELAWIARSVSRALQHYRIGESGHYAHPYFPPEIFPAVDLVSQILLRCDFGESEVYFKKINQGSIEGGFERIIEQTIGKVKEILKSFGKGANDSQKTIRDVANKIEQFRETTSGVEKSTVDLGLGIASVGVENLRTFLVITNANVVEVKSTDSPRGLR